MADRHTLEELNNCSREELITIVLMMQGQLDTLNENIERLIEQMCIRDSYEAVDERTGASLRNILEDTLDEFDDLSVNDKMCIRDSCLIEQELLMIQGRII